VPVFLVETFPCLPCTDPDRNPIRGTLFHARWDEANRTPLSLSHSSPFGDSIEVLWLTSPPRVSDLLPSFRRVVGRLLPGAPFPFSQPLMGKPFVVPTPMFAVSSFPLFPSARDLPFPFSSSNQTFFFFFPSKAQSLLFVDCQNQACVSPLSPFFLFVPNKKSKRLLVPFHVIGRRALLSAPKNFFDVSFSKRLITVLPGLCQDDSPRSKTFPPFWAAENTNFFRSAGFSPSSPHKALRPQGFSLLS